MLLESIKRSRQWGAPVLMHQDICHNSNSAASLIDAIKNAQKKSPAKFAGEDIRVHLPVMSSQKRTVVRKDLWQWYDTVAVIHSLQLCNGKGYYQT